MSIHEEWHRAVVAITAEYDVLAPDARRFVQERIPRIRACKAELQALAGKGNGGAVCASCGGECCIRGGGHFTVVDLLVMLGSGRPIFSPRFEHEICPYLGVEGCLMDPPYRPFNCITFNCELIEGLLTPGDLERFAAVERELRALYGELERYFDRRFRYGLLTTYDRSIAAGEGVLARCPVLPGGS